MYLPLYPGPCPGEAHTGFIPGECHQAMASGNLPLILILIYGMNTVDSLQIYFQAHVNLQFVSLGLCKL